MSAADPTSGELLAEAVRRKEADIDRYAEALRERHLEHNGHRYCADPHSAETVSGTLAVVMMMADTDPIPTPPPVAGCWLTADIDPQTGRRVAEPMTCAQFKPFARTMFDRNALLWGARQVHYATVEAMAAGGATAEQILQYDHTAGWPQT